MVEPTSDVTAEEQPARAREGLLLDFPELGPGREPAGAAAVVNVALGSPAETTSSDAGVAAEAAPSAALDDDAAASDAPAAPPSAAPADSDSPAPSEPAVRRATLPLAGPRALTAAEYGSIALAVLVVAVPGLLIVAPDEWLLSHHLLNFRDQHPLWMSAGLAGGTLGGGVLLWHFRTSEAREAYEVRRRAKKARKLEALFAQLVHAEKDALARLCEQETVNFGSHDPELSVAMNGLYQHGFVEIERLGPTGLRARLRPRRRAAALGWWSESEFRRLEQRAD